MPKMGVNPEKLKAPKPIPGNQVYTLRFLGFKPDASKKGDSVNFNGQFEVTNHPEYDGHKVYATLNSQMAGQCQDVAHALGFAMEEDGSWPGEFIPADPAKPDVIKGMTYKGPLLGKTGKFELVIDNYGGNERNVIKNCQCAIDSCNTKYPDVRHSTDWNKKKS